MMFIRNLLLGLALALPALFLAANFDRAAAQDYYKDKTINVIIGRPAGSGADLTVRAFLQAWQKYIPGNPNFVARNMPGGGGMKVFNHVWEKAEPDGLTIAFTPYNPLPQILKQKSLNADFTKMPLVGALQNPSLTIASTDAVKSRDDITKISNPVYGGQRVLHRFDLAGRMTLDMIGAEGKYKYAPGFKGSGQVAKALQRGEIQLMTAGNNVYQTYVVPNMVSKGKATPLWYHPGRTLDGKYVDMSSIFGDIPSFPDYYKKIHGKEPSGEIYEFYQWLLSVVNGMSYVALLPPGTKEDQLKILEEAFVKVTNDAEYKANEMKRFGFNLPVVSRATGRHFTSLLNKVPASHLEFLDAYSKKVTTQKN